jgi:membrane protein YqaA with SNARE-associated domain
MLEEILKAIPLYLLSMLKVVFGLFGGYAAGLNVFTTMFITFAGMMTSVVVIVFFGSLLEKSFLKAWFARREEKARHSKWKKYGLAGIAILTPLLLTPIGGALLALVSGYPRARIVLYMFISASVFSILATLGIYYWLPPVIGYFKSVFQGIG